MADNYDTQVKFGADTGELKAGMEQAANEVKRSTGVMGDSFKGMASSIKSSMSQVAQNVAHGAKESTEKLEGLSSGLNSLRSKFILLGEVMAAGFIGERLGELGKRFAELSEEILLTSQKTGMTTDQVQELGFAASLSGSSVDSMATAMRKLSLMIVAANSGSAEAVAAFHNVGISQEEVKNSSPHEIFMKIADAYKNAEDGANKTANSVQLLGRAGTELIPTLNKGSDGINDMAQKARELGIILDKETIEKGDAANEKFEVLHATMGAMYNRIGADMLPVFVTLAKAFTESSQKGGILNTVMSAIGAVFKFVEFAILGVVTMLKMAGEAIAMVMAMYTHPLQAGAIWDDFKRRIKEIKDEAHAAAAELRGVSAAAPKGGEDGAKTGHIGGDTGTKTKTGAAASQMTIWKEALEKKKEDELGFFKESTQMEVEFWTAKVNASKRGSKNRLAAEHELYAASKQQAHEALAVQISEINYQMALAKSDTAQKVALAKQQAKLIGDTYGEKDHRYIESMRKVEEAERAHTAEMDKLEQLKIDAVRESAAARIDIERESLRFKKEMGDISEADEINGLRKLKEQEFQIELKAAQDKLQFIKDDVVARRTAMDQIEQMTRKHALDMTKLEHNASISVRKDWQGIFAPISSAFSSSIKGMIQGTMTFKNAMGGIAKAILGTFVDMGVKMVADWAVKQAMKLLISTGIIAEEKAVQTAATATQLAQQKIVGVAGVASNAAIAATAAMASVAVIPGWGWAAAPGVGASTYGIAMGYLASAENGYDIPGGVNPLAQLHQREMVLPAKQADVIRDMADGGGTGGGVTVHINAVDAHSVKRLFTEHGSSLVKALKTQTRNFAHV